MTKKITQTLISILFLFSNRQGYAQDTLNAQSGDFIPFRPKAVLVQLRSEHNRIAALTKDRRFKEVEEVKIDAVNTASKMIADFQDNFSFCPVYYYLDTNIDLIKNKMFRGALLKANGTVANDLVISESSKDYVVVFYGYPVYQPRNTSVVTDSNDYKFPEPNSKGIIVLNDKFQQIAYRSLFEYHNSLFKTHINKKYKYLSKRFDIEYFPYAGYLNTKFATKWPSMP